MRKSQFELIALLMALTFAIAGCSHVADDWKAAQAADTTEAYQDFLRQHADSEFGVPAQQRVQQLAEDRDWQLASKADTLDAYQQFLAAHADGKWAQEARVRIENFQLSAGGQSPPAMPGAEGAPRTAAPPTAKAETPAAAAAHGTTAAAAAKPPARHLAQLGAFSSRHNAESAWHQISGRFPAQLKSLAPHYAAVTPANAKPVVRLQVALPSAQQAHELCAELKKHSQPCVPLG